MKFRVAVAQIDAKIGNLRSNIEYHLDYIERAKREKADLILFPELSLTGYTLRDLVWDLAIDPQTDPRIDPIREASKEISIVVGCVEGGKNHGIYNSAVMFEDGFIKHIHRKSYLPTYGMFEEGRYFSAGKEIRAFDSKHGRFGILICEDMWHPSLPYLLALDGAEVIITLSASPTRLGTADEQMSNAQVNYEHHRCYARLLSVYHLFCNRVGFEDGVNFWGGSSITKPSGEMHQTAKYFDEDMIYGELDGMEVQRARRLSRHFLDEDPTIVLRELKRITEA